MNVRALIEYQDFAVVTNISNFDLGVRPTFENSNLANNFKTVSAKASKFRFHMSIPMTFPRPFLGYQHFRSSDLDLLVWHIVEKCKLNKCKLNNKFSKVSARVLISHTSISCDLSTAACIKKFVLVTLAIFGIGHYWGICVSQTHLVLPQKCPDLTSC